MSNYISSITTKYGDVENVKRDVKTLNEILGRQGPSLILDVIANMIGEKIIQFKLSDAEALRLIGSVTSELNESILERT